MELVVFTLFLLWGMERLFKKKYLQANQHKSFPLYVFLLPFIIIPLIQLLPIGSSLLQIISPALFLIKEKAAIPDSLDFPSFISVNPFSTQSSLKLLITCFLIFIISAALFKRKAHLKRAIFFLTALSFIISLFGIIQYFSWNGKLYWLRPLKAGAPFGPFVNHNHFASFTNMAMLPLLSLLLFQYGNGIKKNMVNRGETIILVFSLSLSLFALLLCGSRGGLVSLLLAIILQVFILWREGEYKRKIFLFSLIGSFVCALFILVGSRSVLETISSLYRVSEDPSFHYRLKGWRASLDIVSDYPLLGTGLGTYKDIFPLYRPFDMEKTFHYAHNEYIQLLAETGIIGFFLLLVPFLILLLKNNPIKVNIRDREKRYLQAGIYSAIVALLIHNTVEFNMRIPSNAYLFSFLCGLYLSTAKKRFFFGKEHYLIMTMVTALFLSMTFLEGIRFFNYTNNSDAAVRERNEEGFLRFTNDPDLLFKRSQYLLRENEVNRAIDVLDQAIISAPLRAHYWALMSYMKELVRNKDESMRALKMAAALDPVRPSYALKVARAASGEETFNNSVKQLKKIALRRSDRFYAIVELLIDNNIDSHEIMEMALDSKSSITIARLLSNKGDDKGARLAYSKAIQLEPENERYIDLYAHYLMKMKDFDSLLKRDRLNKNKLPERFIYWQSRVLLELGDKEAAIALLNNIISVGKDRLKKYGEEVAQLYLQNKDHSKAIEVAEKVLQVNSRSVRSFHILGAAYEETGRPLEAINSYRRLSVIAPADFNVHYKLANLYEKEGIEKMAIKEYETCLDIKPGNIKTRLKLGDLFVLLGKDSEAFRQYQTVLTLDPANSAVISRLEKMNRN